MRKTQVALAALALVASTAALADVAVYGVADFNVINTDNGTSVGGAGNSAGSIYGLKGSEDLGSGLKASFLLEGGYSTATGQAANGGASTGVFNRQTIVGLGNDTIELKAGFQISPFITASLVGVGGLGGNGVFVPALVRLGSSNLSAVDGTQTGGTGGVASGGFFIPESVNLSINAGGATINALTRVGGRGDEYKAASVTTSIGGANIAAAYQNITDVSASKSSTNYMIGGNTTFGDVTIHGAYGNTSGTSFTAQNGGGYVLGAHMPVAGALAAGITYAKGADDSIGSQTSLSAKYTLSKATYAYLNWSQFGKAVGGINASNDGGSYATGATSKRLIALGVAHSF